MRLIKQYFKDLYMLFISETINNKFHIFFIYNYFCLKAMWFKLFNINFKKESFLWLTVFFDNYSAFFAQFAEIFIYNIYYFKSKNKVPFIIDCWWNIWMSILYFKYIYPNSKIICFEPDKYAFEFLSKMIYKNKFKDVDIINKAVSNEEWKAIFYSYKDIKWWSWNSLESNYATFDREEFEVELYRLSKIDMKYIDFLKIDIEWSEGKLFEDFEKTWFLSKVENINLEYHYDYNSKNNYLSNILKPLEKNNFNILINWNIFQIMYHSYNNYIKWPWKYLLIIQAFK